jgi:hypothetical protein
MGSFIGSIEPNESALLISMLAIALSDGLAADEKASLGAFIAAAGDTITLIGTQELLVAGSRNSTTGGN